MWLLLCLALFFSSGETAIATTAEQIELFDSDQQKVVATFDNTAALQAEAQHMLDSVSGRVLEFNPSLDHVMIVKIPLIPPKHLALRSAGIDADISEMFVIMPKQGSRPPWLILHTKQYETVVVEFSGSVKKLREQVKLP
ncbi:hypothetical protein AN963_28450 [Brevibacillus choshinensis]|uniref:Uncharacterized protein n=1 Tax=Brevibacillus choshinensis TaxID=54911 RepID=A0ABR5MZC4_BRECH|nr:hypothetical protein [Brevibacillus choshinensis]KQL43394.1 hypothetical protein AN963_28450 [Brevibacillus choshinensis]